MRFTLVLNSLARCCAGIPIEKVSSDESERLIKMEETLHNRVIGQEEAVVAISRAIRRARVGEQPLACLALSVMMLSSWLHSPPHSLQHTDDAASMGVSLCSPRASRPRCFMANPLCDPLTAPLQG